MKRIVTIQDISCVGRCSLTVALPLISAAGVECAVIPTAVLSAHTAFDSFSVADLTDNMNDVIGEWKKGDMTFDCVYTGYLASLRQLDIVSAFIRSADSAKVFVDPVMGDFGRLYKGFTADFPSKMADLCSSADVIMPNITEICAMTGTAHREDFTLGEISDMAKKMCSGGCGECIVTGVSDKDGGIGVLIYSGADGSVTTHFTENIDTGFPLHGTGDIFASVCVGAAVRGLSAASAAALAADFTADCVRATAENPERRWYGVDFEEKIPELIEKLEEKLNGKQ